MTQTMVPGAGSPAAKTYEARAYAASSASSALAPVTIRRREPRPQDVQIDVLFCGVCHSDLHQARNEWQKIMPTVYPCVPGHEIVGRVVKAGSAVRKFKEGDLAAVGCMVDSCRTCAACRDGQEQFCEGPATFTYNSPDTHLGGVTYGGYSDSLVVDEAFALRVSDRLDPAGAAPLLCAGITTYSPLRHWNVGKGQKVGVVGLGGLGHMAVKFANAFGARVVVFTTSPGKAEDAVRLGAHDVVVSKNAAEMQKQAGSFDFILDTVSAAARPERLPRPLEARRHADAGGRAGGSRCRWACSASCSGGGGSPARSSAASGRPRRCWTSARSTGSRPTSR